MSEYKEKMDVFHLELKRLESPEYIKVRGEVTAFFDRAQLIFKNKEFKENYVYCRT